VKTGRRLGLLRDAAIGEKLGEHCPGSRGARPPTRLMGESGVQATAMPPFLLSVPLLRRGGCQKATSGGRGGGVPCSRRMHNGRQAFKRVVRRRRGRLAPLRRPPPAGSASAPREESKPSGPAAAEQLLLRRRARVWLPCGSGGVGRCAPVRGSLHVLCEREARAAGARARKSGSRMTGAPPLAPQAALVARPGAVTRASGGPLSRGQRLQRAPHLPQRRSTSAPSTAGRCTRPTIAATLPPRGPVCCCWSLRGGSRAWRWERPPAAAAAAMAAFQCSLRWCRGVVGRGGGDGTCLPKE